MQINEITESIELVNGETSYLVDIDKWYMIEECNIIFSRLSYLTSKFYMFLNY